MFLVNLHQDVVYQLFLWSGNQPNTTFLAAATATAAAAGTAADSVAIPKTHPENSI